MHSLNIMGEVDGIRIFQTSQSLLFVRSSTDTGLAALAAKYRSIIVLLII